jgi:hypothetical protein
LRNLIVEEKAKQIVDAWADTVVEQLRATVPKGSGALAEAILKRTPPERISIGWVVGIGDMELIGAGPFDPPPPNTISAFLEMWYKEAGGAQEIADRKTSREDRLRAKDERLQERADEVEKTKKEREWLKASYDKEADALRSIREAEKDKDLKLERREETGYPEERQAAWRLRRQEREAAIERIERVGAAGYVRKVEGKDVYAETYEMTRLRRQHAMALAREQKWTARATARQRKIEALETRIAAMRRLIAEEQSRRLRRLQKRG